jgi:hypothetical protein
LALEVITCVPLLGLPERAERPPGSELERLRARLDEQFGEVREEEQRDRRI